MSGYKPSDIDTYLETFPSEVQKILQDIRSTIKTAVPEAQEAFKYDMPTFTFHGNLLHFAAFKSHIGFYSVPTDLPEFKKDLEEYKTGKGSVQFPLNKPIPYDLIRKIAIWRADENKHQTS